LIFLSHGVRSGSPRQEIRMERNREMEEEIKMELTPIIGKFEDA
jgi:hypothetical protein